MESTNSHIQTGHSRQHNRMYDKGIGTKRVRHLVKLYSKTLKTMDHLYALAKRLQIFIKLLWKMEYNFVQEAFCDTLPFQVHLVGSSAEGTAITRLLFANELEFDVMLVKELPEAYIIRDIPQQPGYCYILSKSIDMAPLSFNFLSSHGLTSSDQFSSEMEKMISFANEMLPQTSHGINVCNDIVFALTISTWPDIAESWMNRNRKWPSKEVINQAMINGCQLVPVSKTPGREEYREWRYSFTLAEVELCKAQTLKQKRVYLLIKYMFYQYIKPINKVMSFSTSECVNEELGLQAQMCSAQHHLNSYSLKTTFLWFCEDHPPTDRIWHGTCIQKAAIDFIKLYLKYLQERCIPNYFIPMENLIQEVPQKLLDKYVERIVTLLSSFHVYRPSVYKIDMLVNKHVHVKRFIRQEFFSFNKQCLQYFDLVMLLYTQTLNEDINIVEQEKMRLEKQSKHSGIPKRPVHKQYLDELRDLILQLQTQDLQGVFYEVLMKGISSVTLFLTAILQDITKRKYNISAEQDFISFLYGKLLHDFAVLFTSPTGDFMSERREPLEGSLFDNTDWNSLTLDSIQLNILRSKVKTKGSSNESPTMSTPRIISSVKFYGLSSDETTRVTCVVSNNIDEHPKPNSIRNILSKVFHLLPHKMTFKKPIVVQIEFEEPPKYGTDNIYILYSATSGNQKPHWEVVKKKKNKAHPEMHIVETTSTYCTFTIPSFCLVCVAEHFPGELDRLSNPANNFDVFARLSFEAVHYTGVCSQRWLIKVKVLFSLKNTSTREMDKLPVVKGGLGDIRVHVYDIGNGWNICGSASHWQDVSVMQLQGDRKKEMKFCFYSDNCSECDIFSATVRLHQSENLQNDCELVLTDSCILGSVIPKTQASVSTHTTHTAVQTDTDSTATDTGADSRNTNRETIETSNPNKPVLSASPAEVSKTESREFLNGAASNVTSTPTNSLENVPNGDTANISSEGYENNHHECTKLSPNIPTFVNDMLSSNVELDNSGLSNVSVEHTTPSVSHNRESDIDGKINELAAILDNQPSEDVLQSLCKRLKYSTDMETLFHRARSKNISPALQLLDEWKKKTGGDCGRFKQVYKEYTEHSAD